MEGWPHGTNGVSNIRRLPHKTTENLEVGHKIDGKSSREYEETIWQEEKKPSRVEGQG